MKKKMNQTKKRDFQLKIRQAQKVYREVNRVMHKLEVLGFEWYGVGDIVTDHALNWEIGLDVKGLQKMVDRLRPCLVNIESCILKLKIL